jgi:hypothetical protein
MSQGTAIPPAGLTAPQLEVSNVFVALRDITDQLTEIFRLLSLTPDSTGRLRVALTGSDSIVVSTISAIVTAQVTNLVSVGGNPAILDQPYAGHQAEQSLRSRITIT